MSQRPIIASVVSAVARWSEDAGFAGILVHADNSIVDPWLVAQVIVESTERLSPLVALQPVYMHPYSAAKMLPARLSVRAASSISTSWPADSRTTSSPWTTRRRTTRRYDRAVEYTQIVKALLGTGNPVSFAGRYYVVSNLRMLPPLPQELFPEILISGSSDAGLAAASAIGATPVKYPKAPVDEHAPEEGPAGIRVGIIAREDPNQAWRIAEERFPEDRKGQIAHALAMKVSDSQWHKELSELGAQTGGGRSLYWLRPFENYKTFCPYLVGSYDVVADEIARYLGVGFTTFILDIPPREDELRHTAVAFERARKRTEALGGAAR
jgi:alkanesulfonate monooxygenase